MPRKAPARSVCFCNSVPQSAIEEAIRSGRCRTLDEIFDVTFAGVGACGGSCRPFLLKMLESYAQSGEFPQDPRPKAKKLK